PMPVPTRRSADCPSPIACPCSTSSTCASTSSGASTAGRCERTSTCKMPITAPIPKVSPTITTSPSRAFRGFCPSSPASAYAESFEMSLRKLARSLVLVAGLPLVLTTCGGASFEDPAQIKGLRVVAVQKSAPYPRPGDQVNIKLVFWDGKSTDDDPRNIFVYLSSTPCENPKGDLYYNCLTELGGATPDGGSDVPDGGAPDGDVPDADAPDGDAPEGGTARRGPGAPGFVPITRAGD